jgi:putative Mg2+ transporter-C (MgtC) family protein
MLARYAAQAPRFKTALSPAVLACRLASASERVHKSRASGYGSSMLENFLADFYNPFPSTPWETALARMLVAALMGGLIGWERETHEKPAGLRTHMMIALAACLFTLLGLELVEYDAFQVDHVRADPMRLIDAVTAGVAFLAAGSIITSGGSVKGLTTGASMWMVGAVGVAAGLGEVMLGGFAVVITLIVLWIVGKFRM